MNKRIVVDSAAGFIGSNIIRELNARGCANIIAIDKRVEIGIREYVGKTTFCDMLFLGKAESTARPSVRAEHRLLRILTHTFEGIASIMTTLDKTGYHVA